MDKINVLVVGNSGVGKSTLIEAISGAQIEIGVGEASTKNITVYDSTTWPIRFIDTKGFEYSLIEQIRTINQVKKYTKEQLSANDGGIDAVWYCVEGTSRRMFYHNITLMNKLLRGWKNIPVFAVITKSYSLADEKENIEEVSKAFAKGKAVNLQKIISVVAKAYQINDETIVEPKGIEELCNATIECAPQAKKISKENIARMILLQKRYTANAVTGGATTAAVIVGAVPIPFADSAILVPLEIGLTKAILKIYNVNIKGDVVTAIVGSAAITNVARATLSALKTIPNIATSALNAVVAGVFVAALGEAIIALSENIHTGKIDQNKIEDITSFVEDKIKHNIVLKSLVKYMGDNSENLKGKAPKEIYDNVVKEITDGKKED